MTPENIGLKELGNLAWDPACFMTDEAFQYFVPSMTELALAKGEEYYADQFLFDLESGRIDAFDEEQCAAVSAFLDHLYETMGTEARDDMDGEILGSVMDKLSVRLRSD